MKNIPVVILVLLILGLMAFMLFKNKKQTTQTAPKEPSSSPTTNDYNLFEDLNTQDTGIVGLNSQPSDIEQGGFTGGEYGIEQF